MARMFPGKEITKGVKWLRVIFPSKPSIKLKWVMIVCAIFGTLAIMYSFWIGGNSDPYNPLSFAILVISLPTFMLWAIYCMWLYDETFYINE